MICFSIEKSLLNSFPELHVFAFRASGVQNSLKSVDIAAHLESTILDLKGIYQNSEVLSRSPVIAEWRQIYQRLGLKPSAFRSSIEALLRRVLANKSVETKIPLVDFYNLYSLRYQACLGGYDAAKIDTGEIKLRLCDRAHDTFTPLGGNAANFPLNEKLAVYAINNEILCWGFNCRDSVKSALEEHTSDALFFAEAITPSQKERAIGALKALSYELESAGASVSSIFFTDKEHPRFQFN